MRIMYDAPEVARMIDDGALLMVAGDEKVLSTLPKGSWIGGTTPYFMADQGDLLSQEKLCVTRLPETAARAEISTYGLDEMANIYTDIPDNGFGLVIFPGLSDILYQFALKSPEYDGFATKPLIGWVSGSRVDGGGQVSPKVCDGADAKLREDRAVVIRVTLPPHLGAEIGIVNHFKQGGGDTIIFPEDGFSAKSALINGREVDFPRYIAENGLDIKLPLVADYYGVMVNTSFRDNDPERGAVRFYAPVFKDMEYRLAAVTDSGDNGANACDDEDRILFSCNCVLNYLYKDAAACGETTSFKGPITFGEIAYQLLNQTLTYLKIVAL